MFLVLEVAFLSDAHLFADDWGRLGIKKKDKPKKNKFIFFSRKKNQQKHFPANSAQRTKLPYIVNFQEFLTTSKQIKLTLKEKHLGHFSIFSFVNFENAQYKNVDK